MAESDCGFGLEICRDTHSALKLKVGAVLCILFASAAGVTFPLIAKRIGTVKLTGSFFSVIKAFAAGVVLATGFCHMLPDASAALESPCLSEAWSKFPFAQFVAMLAAIVTLMIDYLGTRWHEKMNRTITVARISSGISPTETKEKEAVTTNDCHHGHGTVVDVPLDLLEEETQLRLKVISEVLEVGIVSHSLIIGISLGVSESPCTIRPLFAVLCFHQLFEGFALGNSIAQANFKLLNVCVMALFFTITTPLGIGIGMGISSSYNENSPQALIVEGLFDSMSAGILIYLALVDLIASDFLSLRVRNDGKLAFSLFVSLISGSMAMAALAIWA